MPVFETGSFNHSDTCPRWEGQNGRIGERDQVMRSWLAAALVIATPVLALAQDGAAPGQCGVLGLCGLFQPERPVPTGVLFVAVGLVAFGIWGLRARRRGR